MLKLAQISKIRRSAKVQTKSHFLEFSASAPIVGSNVTGQQASGSLARFHFFIRVNAQLFEETVNYFKMW